MSQPRHLSAIVATLILLFCLNLFIPATGQSTQATSLTYLPLVVRPVTYDEPSGIPDEDFGVEGVVMTSFPGNEDDAVLALALQPDGKLLAAGYAFNGSDRDFALARYNPDGSLDASFEGVGLLVTDFGGKDEARAIALQPDGKILLAGYTDAYSSFDFALARYNSDGSLDTSFDGDGLLLSDFSGTNDSAFALALQNDGSFLVAGYTYLGSNRDFVLARYLVDGNLDESFGGVGWVSLDFAGKGDQAFALSLQPDGKTLVAGVAEIGSDSADFALARYNTDGTLDTEFDADGWLLTDFDGNYDSATALVLQPDGNIVVAGDSSSDMAVARYQPDGVLDTTFSDDGWLTLDFYTLRDSGKAVILQPDGKLILAGSANFCDEADFALARLTSSGNLDRNFEGDGLLLSYIIEISDYGAALLQQPDGKLVVAGRINSGAGDDFLLARFK